jgi:hypothetical protein
MFCYLGDVPCIRITRFWGPIVEDTLHEVENIRVLPQAAPQPLEEATDNTYKDISSRRFILNFLNMV